MKLQLAFMESVEGGQIISFKTTQAMNKKLDALADQNKTSKSSVIRKFIEYGFRTLDSQNKQK